MSKTTKAVLFTLLGVVLGLAAGSVCNNFVQAKQSVADTSMWNFEKTEAEAVTGSAFTYYAYPSKDNQKAWIYKIDFNSSENAEHLDIPEKINGKTVTRLGWKYDPNDPDVDMGYKNIFGYETDRGHGCYGSGVMVNLIGKVSIPNTVTYLERDTFSEMTMLKEIDIPDSIDTLPYEVLCGCRSLVKVTLPRSLKSISSAAFDECYSLSDVTIDPSCKKYGTKDSCIIEKKNNALFLCYADGKKYNIPKGIKILRSGAFDICRAETVHIPASVTMIEESAFSLHYNQYTSVRYVKNVTVDKKNKVYAKDGQTIYNKKDGSLSISIFKGKKVHRMSNKVKKLTADQNYVIGDSQGLDTDYSMEKLYVSKNLKTVEKDGWGELPDFTLKFYFTSLKPPKILVKKTDRCTLLPDYMYIYVPKKANKAYIKLYKKYDYYNDSIEEWQWHTYKKQPK